MPKKPIKTHSYYHWTEHEVNYLIDNYTYPLSKKLIRYLWPHSRSAIYGKVFLLGITQSPRKPKKWSKKEIDKITKLAKKLPPRKVAAQFPSRTWCSVYNRYYMVKSTKKANKNGK